jgi:large subunit ribosomal protein L30
MSDATGKIHLRQVRSEIGFARDQRATLRGLGLRKLNSRSAVQDTPAVRGMINKVKHLIVVEEA